MQELGYAIRAMQAVDWLVRVHAPAWLRLAGMGPYANDLEAIGEITDIRQAADIRRVLDNVGNAIATARMSYRDVADLAPWDAAKAAARDRCWDKMWSEMRDRCSKDAWAQIGAPASEAAIEAARLAGYEAARHVPPIAAWGEAHSIMEPVQVGMGAVIAA